MIDKENCIINQFYVKEEDIQLLLDNIVKQKGYIIDSIVEEKDRIYAEFITNKVRQVNEYIITKP